MRVREGLMSAIVHFDVPADDAERAKKFYSALFGWKFEPVPGMEVQPLYHDKPGRDPRGRGRHGKKDGSLAEDAELFRGAVP